MSYYFSSDNISARSYLSNAEYYSLEASRAASRADPDAAREAVAEAWREATRCWGAAPDTATARFAAAAARRAERQLDRAWVELYKEEAQKWADFRVVYGDALCNA
jgi:hypothetical protein